MKRLLALIITLILMTPSLALAAPSKGELPPQNVFNFTIFLQVQPAKVGNETTWIGKFHIVVKLVDPQYREYLDELAKNSSESANMLFWTIINNTVLASLRYNVIQKYQATGLHPSFIVPQDGPIRIGNDWNATVDLGVTDFLVLRGHYLVSPMAGNLTLWMANKTYAFNWNRFVLILPPEYTLHELSPKPAQMGGNIAVWVNGSYVPNVSLESPGYSFVKFLNETEGARELKLRYTPEDGHLYFEAIFPAQNAPGVVKGILSYTFKQALHPLSIDVMEENGTIRVVGVAVPPAKKKESWRYTEWEAYVSLPFPFQKIEVSPGEYRELSPVDVVITVKEPKKAWLMYGGVLVGLLLVIVAVKKLSGRGEGSGETESEEEHEEEGELEESEEPGEKLEEPGEGEGEE